MTLVPDDEEWLLLQATTLVSVETSMLVADVIHALRSSLDYLMAALARKAGIGDERILFPFMKSQVAFEQSLKAPTDGKKATRRASDFQKLLGHYPKLETLLRDRIKPYPQNDTSKLGLGHALYTIANADNTDKHRFVALATNITHVGEIVIELGNGAGDFTLSDLSVIGSGFRFPLGSKFKRQPDFSADIIFPEGSMLAGKPVMGAVVQLIEFAGETIAIFEREFATSSG